MTSRASTYYDVLGVARGASAAEIKTAYRASVRRWHPDLHNGSSEAHIRLVEINRAYETLSDPVKRLLYDNEMFGTRTNRGSNGSETPRPRPPGRPPPTPSRPTTPSPATSPRAPTRPPSSIPAGVIRLVTAGLIVVGVLLALVVFITTLAQIATALVVSLLPLVVLWWMVVNALRPGRASRRPG